MAEALMEEAPSTAADTSSFKGGGHSYGGSRGGGRVSSAHLDGGHKNSGRDEWCLVRKVRRIFFSSVRQFRAQFQLREAEASALRQLLAISAASELRNRRRRSSRSTMGRWQSFGNSTGRSMLASAHISGNAMGGGWRSFGNFSHGGGAETSRGFGNICEMTASGIRLEIQRNASFGRNSSGFSSFGPSRVTSSNLHADPPGIQLKSLFAKSAGIDAVLIVLVIFFRPLHRRISEAHALESRASAVPISETRPSAVRASPIRASGRVCH